MDNLREIVVLGGGTSSEREISLASSRAVYQSLAKRHSVRWLDIADERLPAGLHPRQHVIFPVLHGTFGEDGGVQRLLEAEGFAFAGCGSDASALCMDKPRAKARAREEDVPTPPDFCFQVPPVPDVDAIERKLGTAVTVIKPQNEGSSVGLQFADSSESLRQCVGRLRPGAWMIEPRLSGPDVTVGVLAGEALGVVEIRPRDGGPYDFTRKYSPGATEYRYPADLPEGLTDALRRAAAAVFSACGCRDFARVDFMRSGQDGFQFLEINTIPGLTATSLLPKSASCYGYDFDTLIDAMLRPAMERFATVSTF